MRDVLFRAGEERSSVDDAQYWQSPQKKFIDAYNSGSKCESKPLSGSFLKSFYTDTVLARFDGPTQARATLYLNALEGNELYWPLRPHFLRTLKSCEFGTILTSLEDLKKSAKYVSDNFLRIDDVEDTCHVSKSGENIIVTLKNGVQRTLLPSTITDAPYFVLKRQSDGSVLIDDQVGLSAYVQYEERKYYNGPIMTCMTYCWLHGDEIVTAERGAGFHELIACGLPVKCAGEIGWDFEADNYYVTNASGHYLPNATSLEQMRDLFKIKWTVDFEVRTVGAPHVDGGLHKSARCFA